MSIGFSHIDIVGEKIRLRPMRASDAEAAYKLVKNEAVLSTLAWDGPTNEAELRNTYRQWEEEVKTGEGCHMAIEQLEQPGAIGCIDIRFPGHPLRADIGYWLGEPFWNRGYMTDAIRLLCNFSFQYLDTVCIYAPVFAGNIGSRRALEKNGFSLDGTIKSYHCKHSEWKDAWYLTLLRTEWEEKRERFYPRHEEVVVARNKE